MQMRFQGCEGLLHLGRQALLHILFLLFIRLPTSNWGRCGETEATLPVEATAILNLRAC